MYKTSIVFRYTIVTSTKTTIISTFTTRHLLVVGFGLINNIIATDIIAIAAFFRLLVLRLI